MHGKVPAQASPARATASDLHASVPTVRRKGRDVLTHTVQPGQNLYRIAVQYGVSLDDLRSLNRLGASKSVRVGQVLAIPSKGRELTEATPATRAPKVRSVGPEPVKADQVPAQASQRHPLDGGQGAGNAISETPSEDARAASGSRTKAAALARKAPASVRSGSTAALERGTPASGRATPTAALERGAPASVRSGSTAALGRGTPASGRARSTASAAGRQMRGASVAATRAQSHPSLPSIKDLGHTLESDSPGSAESSSTSVESDEPMGADEANVRISYTLIPSADPFSWPVDDGIVRSRFGSRHGRLHAGVDISAPAGSPVHATREGNVIYSGSKMRGYGNVVMIDHGDGFVSLYAHNSKNLVRLGDRVSRGQTIARVGATGNATGYHCHFEVRRANTAIDPMQYLLAGTSGEPLIARARAARQEPQDPTP